MDEIKVKVGTAEVSLTQDAADALQVLQSDGGEVIKTMVNFADAVAMSLAVGGSYMPSEAGKARALQVIADMKQLLYPLINDKTYEQYQ